MRPSVVGIAIVAAAATVRADVSLDRVAGPRAWIAGCTATLERARDTLARLDPALAGGRVRSWVGRPSQADDCTAEAGASVMLESRMGAERYVAQLRVTSGTDETVENAEPWHLRGGVRSTRYEPGREGLVIINAARVEARQLLRGAVDACLALAPARTVTYTAAPSGLSAAEQAAWQLERTCRVERSGICPDARGQSVPCLRRITALGVDNATPVLLRLARSQNPAARAVAAIGLGILPSAVGRAELQRLTTDPSIVETPDGPKAVAQLAREALAR